MIFEIVYTSSSCTGNKSTLQIKIDREHRTFRNFEYYTDVVIAVAVGQANKCQ